MWGFDKRGLKMHFPPTQQVRLHFRWVGLAPSGAGILLLFNAPCQPLIIVKQNKKWGAGDNKHCSLSPRQRPERSSLSWKLHPAGHFLNKWSQIIGSSNPELFAAMVPKLWAVAADSVQITRYSIQCIELALMGCRCQWLCRSREPPVKIIWEPLIYTDWQWISSVLDSKSFAQVQPKMLKTWPGISYMLSLTPELLSFLARDHGACHLLTIALWQLAHINELSHLNQCSNYQLTCITFQQRHFLERTPKIKRYRHAQWGSVLNTTINTCNHGIS